MAFLDNSGDIILDAVLTDAGRARLAKGDGSFKITKFALGDDEINYGLYGGNSPDSMIMQTPVFEAFTNNIASLNSRLISLSRTDILYLPIIKINNTFATNYDFTAATGLVQNGFILAVDQDTEDMLANSQLYFDSDLVGNKGVLKGYNTSGGSSIRLDQGIDNAAIPPAGGLDPTLNETQYLIEINNKLANLINKDSTIINPSYIDDDDMAAYYVSSGDSVPFVEDNRVSDTSNGQVISGARGTFVSFKLKSSIDVSTSRYLFDQLGTDVTSHFKIGSSSGTAAGTEIKKISTSIRVTGLTTGYAVDVPLVLLKKIS